MEKMIPNIVLNRLSGRNKLFGNNILKSIFKVLIEIDGLVNLNQKEKEIIDLILKGETLEDAGRKMGFSGEIARHCFRKISYKVFNSLNKLSVKFYHISELEKKINNLQSINSILNNEKDKKINLNNKNKVDKLTTRLVDCNLPLRIINSIYTYTKIRMVGHLAQHRRCDIIRLPLIGEKGISILDKLLDRNRLKWKTDSKNAKAIEKIIRHKKTRWDKYPKLVEIIENWDKIKIGEEIKHPYLGVLSVSGLRNALFDYYGIATKVGLKCGNYNHAIVKSDGTLIKLKDKE